MKLVKYQSAWCQSCKTQTSLLNTIDLGDVILEQIDIDNLDPLRQPRQRAKAQDWSFD